MLIPIGKDWIVEMNSFNALMKSTKLWQIQKKSADNASHGDVYYIAASSPFRSGACFVALDSTGKIMAADEKSKKPAHHHLLMHRILVFVLYTVATWIAYMLLSIPAAHESFIASLSSAAILATLGSAIATVGSLWTGDYSKRIALNVDILFRDIFKQETWRRWPFLLRAGTKKLFDGNVQQVELQNPKIPLNVGSHDIEVLIPTVQDDFFDLPLLRNVIPLLRFRTAAHTTIINSPQDNVFPQNQLKPMEQYFTYECLTDIWWSVLIFRTARYVVHFGAGLTIASAVIGGTVAFANAV